MKKIHWPGLEPLKKILPLHSKRGMAEVIILFFLAVFALVSLLPPFPRKVSAAPFGENMDFTGVLRNNLFEGEGTLTLADGSTYEGGFSEGFFSGKGSFHSSDGWTFEGTFDKGDPVGTGTLITADQVRWTWTEDGKVTKEGGTENPSEEKGDEQVALQASSTAESESKNLENS